MYNLKRMGVIKMAKDNSKLSQGEEIEFIKNENSEVIMRKSWVALSSDQVRPELLDAFFVVLEEDMGILEDLRDR